MWASPAGRLPALEECEDEEADVNTGKMASCWGRFGVAALWGRLRQLSLARRRARHGRSILGAGGLNYDPLSYAQNFEDSSLELEHHEPDFSARFAPARSARRAF
ncbi:uncharacterized protein LOC124669452 [Lolium rigidum]|uniref:uncharacterized protein LOC124669452 n=1 Tax=Lolium rigidum TaxID=89674 RepID=UPI001F5D62C7|nr:uncharacterized protein LOC124669452 [Lolium rigidum]